MASKVAQLEDEVRSIQDDLARDLDVLASYLPTPDNIARIMAVVAAVAIGAWILVSWLAGARRRASDRKNIKRAVREVLAEDD